MTLALLLTAFGLGLRHGVDWDHVAAIADLSSSARDRRRGFALSFLYAVGHGAVVLAIGSVAVVLGLTLPDGVDRWAGRVVGATLVVLGAWIVIELVRRGREFRLRSRWILVLGGTFAGLRRVRRAASDRRVAIEHDHEHQHHLDVDPYPDPSSGVDGRPGPAGHDDSQAHDHPHDDRSGDRSDDDLHVPFHRLAPSAGAAGAVGGRWPTETDVTGPDARSELPAPVATSAPRHQHRHRHELMLADGRGNGPGNGVAAGVGVLHGIGVESPTQIAVFVASTSVVGAGPGFALLALWVLGLIIANSALAAVAAAGLLNAERNFEIYAAVAVTVAVISVLMGSILIARS